MIESKTTGLNEVLARIDSLREAPRIKSGCAAEGYHDVGVANATILASQAKQGRAPAFLDAGEDGRGTQLAREMVAAWVDGDADGVYRRAQELARLIVDAVRRHIESGRSEAGPMKPLTKRYEAIKKHVWHAGGKPILVRTGKLLASLVPSVSVRGGKR